MQSSGVMVGYLIAGALGCIMGLLFVMEAGFQTKRKKESDAWLGNFVARLMFMGANALISFGFCDVYKHELLPWILLGMILGNREFLILYGLFNAPAAPPEEAKV